MIIEEEPAKNEEEDLDEEELLERAKLLSLQEPANIDQEKKKEEISQPSMKKE